MISENIVNQDPQHQICQINRPIGWTVGRANHITPYGPNYFFEIKEHPLQIRNGVCCWDIEIEPHGHIGIPGKGVSIFKTPHRERRPRSGRKKSSVLLCLLLQEFKTR